MAQYVAVGTVEAEQMLCACMSNNFILATGTLAAANEDDWAAMSNMKGIGLNLATLSHEILYQL